MPQGKNAQRLGMMVVLASRGGQAKSGGFVSPTVQSFMGLIVMAMGVQFAAEGLTKLIKGGGV